MGTLSGLADLDRRFGIPGIASVSEGNGAMPRVQITSSLCEAEMYLHGAQVTSWKPAGSGEVLFLSGKSGWTDGQAIRGGIPICFPWFRAKANDPQAPAHGFVRTKTWQLESILKEDDAVAVSLFTESDEHTRPGGRKSSDSFIALLSALNSSWSLFALIRGQRPCASKKRSTPTTVWRMFSMCACTVWTR